MLSYVEWHRRKAAQLQRFATLLHISAHCTLVEDQQVIFVELGDRGFEAEIAARDLKFLHEIGGSGEQHAPALFHQGQTERGRQV